MPLPSPESGESRDVFMERCMGAIADEFADPKQRYAVCSGIYEDAKRMDHTQLVEAIRARKSSGTFGYGITTADQYVSRIADEIGSSKLAQYATDLDEAVKLAGMRLTFANDGSKQQQYATSNFSDMLPDGIRAPNNTLMLIRHIVTTPREDRDKDVLRTDGAELDPKAPLLWQHLHTMPIGKVVAKLEHTPDRLVVCSALLDLNDLTSDVAKLVEADVLRFSHGFIAREWKERKKPDNHAEPVGFEVTKFEIMEVSLVSVPSNVDAEIELWSSGKLTSDAFKAHAKHLSDSRQKVFRGVELPKSVASKVLQKGFDVELQRLEASRLEYDWVSRYIGCEIKELLVTMSCIPKFRAGGVLSGLRSVTCDWKVRDTRNMTRDGKEMPPVHDVVQINSRSSDAFLVEGIRFYEKPDGTKMCLKFEDSWHGIVVTVYTKEPNEDVVEKAWEWAAANAPLKGEAMTLCGEFLRRGDQSIDDVFLEEQNHKPIARALNLISTKGAEMANRGMIFMGPPGTGKTMSGRALMNQAKATFIWVSAKDFWKMGSVGGLCSAFELARELSPSIVFVEDVDNWLSDSSMDVIKTEMDGIARSSGILTILTTNYPERLPDALIDRPGRFHDVLKFGLPSDQIRKNMLQTWTSCTDHEIDDVVAKTATYSGAHLWELVQYGKTLADEDSCTLHSALLRAVEKIDTQRKLIDESQLAGSHYRHRSTVGMACDVSDNGPAVMCEFTSAKTVSTKYGRVLSETNFSTLQDVADDMDELLGMDGLPRPARALGERCRRKLQDVLDKAMESKPDEEEPESVPDNVTSVDHVTGHMERHHETELADVLLYITQANQSSLKIVSEVVKAAEEVRARNELGRQLSQIARS